MLKGKWQTCMILVIFMLSDATDAYVGISIGTDIVNLASASEIVSVLQSHKIKHVRLFDADHQMLKALANTGIEVMVSVPNNQLRSIGESQTRAAEWIHKNITPFVPETNITCIAVGNQVLTTLPYSAHVLVPAMEHLHSALLAADLNWEVKVSSPQSMEMILEPFPPSTASFNSIWNPIMYSFLQFLKNTGSSFILNAHPDMYHLFKPFPSNEQIADPNTLLYYSNMFNAIVDAAYYSMEALNFSGISVLVTESKWPRAKSENALAYDNSPIWQMHRQSVMPNWPDTSVSIYINDFFNEELQHGKVSSRMMYSLHFLTEADVVTSTPRLAGEFCVAINSSDSSALLAGLNWACGPGSANCSAIQPGQPCYDANSLAALASYAYNDYYQRTKANGSSCNFNNTAVLTFTDPSHGSCIFTGSGTNTGGGGANTNSSSGGGGLVPNPALAPTDFGNGVSRLQILSSTYLVVTVILLSWFKM